MTMSLFRKSWVTPILAMVLMASVMAAQAAGCCKLGDLTDAIGMAPSPKAEPQPAEHSPTADGQGHCCPASKASHPNPNPGENQDSDCFGGKGCCLKDSNLNEDKVPQALFQYQGFAPILVYFLAPLVAAPEERVRLDAAGPILDGPPLFLFQRRLLI